MECWILWKRTFAQIALEAISKRRLHVFSAVHFADLPSPALSRVEHAEGSAAAELPSGPAGLQLSSDSAV